MILVVTPHLAADQCEEIHRATNEKVILTESLREAVALLRIETYLAVVLDQYVVETEPQELETVMRQLGTAIPLQVNLAVSGLSRLIREVRLAVQRRHHEAAAARRAALHMLQCELNGTVTALLLCCELALSHPGLSLVAVENIESAHNLVKKLRGQMESALAEE
jgi:hypothetical protein